MRSFFDWCVSNDSLPYRIMMGLAIFATLAVADLYQKRERATRWREYLFLTICVVFAIGYGIANDLITSRISIEYFLFGKGVAERVSAEVAANPEAHRGELDLQAMRIGTLATWSAGLIAGAAMLVTNTLSSRPRLRMRKMLWLIPVIGVAAILFAIVGGFIGTTDFYARFSSDFAQMIARDEMRPRRFIAVFGIHLGGYVGGLIGLVVACVVIWRKRSLPQESDSIHELKPSQRV